MKEPSYFYEDYLRSRGFGIVCGVDEVGRGSIAGELLATCIGLPTGLDKKNIRDSKTLSEKQRSEMSNYILENIVAIGFGSASVEEIDSLNVLEATKLAMARAINTCRPKPDYVIIDGSVLELDTDIPKSFIINADSVSVVVAAASIVAKLTRDAEMKYNLHEKFPMYGWDRNKGYGTRDHYRAIEEYGICEYHRKSFNLGKHEWKKT